MPKVIISGLTAAGKTTHAALLADDLGYERLHVTDILLGELGTVDNDASRIWFRRLREIESLRSDGAADDRVDDILIRALESDPNIVIDAWALPWHARSLDSAITIWIGSDRLSRTWKCALSSGDREFSDLARYAHLIDEKDQASRDRFLSRYGFDLYTDRSVFDFVLDNSHMLRTPRIDEMELGIANFRRVIYACVCAALSGSAEPLEEIAYAGETYLSSIVRIGERFSWLEPTRKIALLNNGVLPNRII